MLEMGFDFGKPSPTDIDKIENYIRSNYGDDAGDAFINGYTY